jgi:hypothetical protein
MTANDTLVSSNLACTLARAIRDGCIRRCSRRERAYCCRLRRARRGWRTRQREGVAKAKAEAEGKYRGRKPTVRSHAAEIVRLKVDEKLSDAENSAPARRAPRERRQGAQGPNGDVNSRWIKFAGPPDILSQLKVSRGGDRTRVGLPHFKYLKKA